MGGVEFISTLEFLQLQLVIDFLDLLVPSASLMRGERPCLTPDFVLRHRHSLKPLLDQRHMW